MPAEDSLKIQGLPIGLAHGLVLKREVKKDHKLSWEDVEFDESSLVVKIRREMEETFRKEMKGGNGVVNGH
jgi:predicted homoserine dehydrogenase-like protein